MASEDTVLVTGGSGYIGGWCIARLLNDGFKVRATVRSLAREAEVRRALDTVAPAAGGDRLAFVAADLDLDEGWAAAAEGCRYLLHVASPVGPAKGLDPELFIRPARSGALRALKAAIAAGVERVVMTSSSTAVASATGPGRFDETHWTDPAAKGVLGYAQSKVLAERAAWDLIGKAGGRTTLATILPVFVIGPVTSADYSPSILAISRSLKGEFPGIPNLGLDYVDVRDVADLHVRAMLAPAAAGERFIASSGFLWLSEVTAILRENLGAAAAKVPTRRLPDWLVRIVGLFDREVGSMIEFLSQRVELEFEQGAARSRLEVAARARIDPRLRKQPHRPRAGLTRPPEGGNHPNRLRKKLSESNTIAMEPKHRPVVTKGS